MSISLQKLRNFVIVAEERQFLRASQRLGISQPTLSAQIRELEGELGVPLFNRTTRQVNLTTEGDRFFHRAKQILSDVEIAVSEAKQQAALKHGRVTIAATPSIAASLVPPVMAEFRLAFPDIDVRLIEDISQVVDNLVRTGIADFGVGPGRGRQTDLTFSPLFEERFLAVARSGHALSGAKSVTLAQLTEHDLITTGQGTGIRDVVEGALRDKGLDVGMPHSMTHVETVISMVESGLGVALLPELSLSRVDRRRIDIISVTEPEIVRSVGLIERKGGSPSSASTAFVALLRSNKVLDQFMGARIGDRSRRGRGGRLHPDVGPKNGEPAA